MAKTIRSPQTAVQNWTQRAGAAAGFYNAQVQAAAWKQFAAAPQAEANYAAGVQKAVANKSRQAGVNASSDEAWKAGVAAIGQARFSQGVTASSPRMAAAMGKLIPAIDALRKSLPARGIAGSQDNINRMTQFVQGLAKQKGTFKARGVARQG
jgi:hypothetical protein